MTNLLLRPAVAISIRPVQAFRRGVCPGRCSLILPEPCQGPLRGETPSPRRNRPDRGSRVSSGEVVFRYRRSAGAWVRLGSIMLPEERHVLSILKTTMRVLGYSNRDIERELGLSGSYLSRLFSGDIDLRFSHILNISRAMGLAPEEILLLAYPHTEAPKSEAASRWAASLFGA